MSDTSGAEDATVEMVSGFVEGPGKDEFLLLEVAVPLSKNVEPLQPQEIGGCHMLVGSEGRCGPTFAGS